MLFQYSTRTFEETGRRATVGDDPHVFVRSVNAVSELNARLTDVRDTGDTERDGFGEPTTVTVGMNPFGLAFVR